MATYAQPISIEWGTDSAPTAVRVVDAAGAVHAPALTTAIAEVVTGSGVYSAVATFDQAWGACSDYWLGADGVGYAGDGPRAVNVTNVNGGPATLDTGGGAGGTGTGSGDFAVDHNGGTGVTVNGAAAAADCMRFTASGVGVDNVEIAAFLQADYAAGARGAADRRGTTYSGSDGRWEAPLMLDDGTYTILASKGGYLITTLTVVVP